MISDDFTGALDTGIQFAKYGAVTKILTTSTVDQKWFEADFIDILVIDAELRHLSSADAYQITFQLVRQAMLANGPYVYIKTDSGLRGNIGVELKAALDASGKSFLPFLPAFPDMNRVTRNGIHFVDGVPIDQSVFGKDPFEPVKSPYVKDLFRGTGISTQTLERAQVYDTAYREPTIGIFDVQSNDDFYPIAGHLKAQGQLNVVAGCAGFAAILPELIGMKQTQNEIPMINKPLLVVCGSLNPITKKQIEYGERMGFARIVMTPRQQLDESYFETQEGCQWLDSLDGVFSNQVVMVDTGISNPRVMTNYVEHSGISNDEIRVRITKTLGRFLKQLLERGKINDRMLMIIGGDTLLGFVEQIHCHEITLLCEMEPGTVLSSIDMDGKRILMISKSGGFGSENLLEQLAKQIGA